MVDIPSELPWPLEGLLIFLFRAVLGKFHLGYKAPRREGLPCRTWFSQRKAKDQNRRGLRSRSTPLPGVEISVNSPARCLDRAFVANPAPQLPGRQSPSKKDVKFAAGQGLALVHLESLRSIHHATQFFFTLVGGMLGRYHCVPSGYAMPQAVSVLGMVGPFFRHLARLRGPVGGGADVLREGLQWDWPIPTDCSMSF